MTYDNEPLYHTLCSQGMLGQFRSVSRNFMLNIDIYDQ